MRARQQSHDIQASAGGDYLPSRFVRHLPESARAAFLLGRWSNRKPLGRVESGVMWSMGVLVFIGIGVAVFSFAPILENPDEATQERVGRGLFGILGALIPFAVFSWFLTKPRLVRLTDGGVEADTAFEGRVRVPLARIQEIEVTQMKHPLGTETWMIVVHSTDRRIELGQGVPKADLEWVRDRLLDELDRLRPASEPTPPVR